MPISQSQSFLFALAWTFPFFSYNTGEKYAKEITSSISRWSMDWSYQSSSWWDWCNYRKIWISWAWPWSNSWVKSICSYWYIRWLSLSCASFSKVWTPYRAIYSKWTEYIYRSWLPHNISLLSIHNDEANLWEIWRTTRKEYLNWTSIPPLWDTRGISR